MFCHQPVPDRTVYVTVEQDGGIGDGQVAARGEGRASETSAGLRATGRTDGRAGSRYDWNFRGVEAKQWAQDPRMSDSRRRAEN